MPFKRFAAQLTETNNFIPLLPGSDNSKKMPPEELNNTIIHVLPRGREKKSYLQWWDFEMKTYRETCAMFELTEIDEQVYEGQTPSKKN